MSQRDMRPWYQVQYVRAKRALFDSPLSRAPAHAKRGTLGELQDIDRAAGLLIVDFGKGAILVDPKEVRPA